MKMSSKSLYKKEKRSRIESYVPPGIYPVQEIRYWLVLLIVATLWCVPYVFRYLEQRDALYVIRAGRKVLMEGVVIVPFEELTGQLFDVFYLLILYCAIVTAYHYYYHYQGSRMMYLMRRLPNKWEVHIRCLFLPLAGSVLAVLYAVLLKLLFFAIYIFCTPSQCLPFLR